MLRLIGDCRGLSYGSWQAMWFQGLGRVIALAEVSFGPAKGARQWLTEPHLMLGAMPIMMAATDLGARQVEPLLHNIAYDLPA